VGGVEWPATGPSRWLELTHSETEHMHHQQQQFDVDHRIVAGGSHACTGIGDALECA
jgi:hypothetical protein